MSLYSDYTVGRNVIENRRLLNLFKALPRGLTYTAWELYEIAHNELRTCTPLSEALFKIVPRGLTKRQGAGRLVSAPLGHLEFRTIEKERLMRIPASKPARWAIVQEDPNS